MTYPKMQPCPKCKQEPALFAYEGWNGGTWCGEAAMITPTRIAEITALAEAATPGPWYTLDPPWLPSDAYTSILAESPDPHVARFICDFDPWTLDEETDKVSERPDADAAFIAAARTAVPELLAEREAMVARMVELAEAVVAVVDAIRDYLPPDGIDAQECLNRIIGAIDNPIINPIIAEIENGPA